MDSTIRDFDHPLDCKLHSSEQGLGTVYWTNLLFIIGMEKSKQFITRG